MNTKSEPFGVYGLIDTVPAVWRPDEKVASYTTPTGEKYFRTDVAEVGNEHYQLYHLGDIPPGVTCPTEFPHHIKALKEKFQTEISANLIGGKSLFSLLWVIVTRRVPDANGKKSAFQPPIFTELTE